MVLERAHRPDKRAQSFDRYYATNAGNTGFWDPPPGDPGGAANIFAWSIHERGAMTL